MRRAGVPVRGLFLGLLPLVLMAATTQFPQFRRGGWRPNPLREGLPTRDDTVDRGFTFCRLLYTSVRREAGGYGWNTDYPMSDHNFMTRFEQLTTVGISRWEDDEPGYAVVRPLDDTLFECPFLFASDVGTAGFTEAEVERLRTWILKGGFLWVDDFWGNLAWNQWVREIGRILPEYTIVDLPLDHPLLHALYQVPAIPQVPSIQFWRGEGRRRHTSERGVESAEPHLRVILDDAERLLVLMTHNTDVADGWEREGEDDEFFYTFSPESYALGINVVVWALSH